MLALPRLHQAHFPVCLIETRVGKTARPLREWGCERTGKPCLRWSPDSLRSHLYRDLGVTYEEKPKWGQEARHLPSQALISYSLKGGHFVPDDTSHNLEVKSGPYDLDPLPCLPDSMSNFRDMSWAFFLHQ